MKRTLEVGIVEDDAGNTYFDRPTADRLLEFALETLEQFGGTWGLVPVRHELDDGSYELVGLKLFYDSFAPAQKREIAAVEPLPEVDDVEEPVAA